MESHLLQMRGLKQIYQSQVNGDFGVASFTDAWIETKCCFYIERGLESHLLQMRGLKLSASTLSSGGTVASFTDAWIETCKPALKTRPLLVASFTDAWIETNYRQKEHRHH